MEKVKGSMKKTYYYKRKLCFYSLHETTNEMSTRVDFTRNKKNRIQNTYFYGSAILKSWHNIVFKKVYFIYWTGKVDSYI